MGNKHPTLLPAPPPGMDLTSFPSRPELYPRVSKRQPVRAACNNCRLKKTKVHNAVLNIDSVYLILTFGRYQHAIACQYTTANENETSSMALKSHIKSLETRLQKHADILQSLRSAPECDALDLLRRLRASSQLSSALASIKGSMATGYRPSELLTARAMLPPTHSSVEFELTLLHEIVYPGLLPLDIGNIDIDHMLRAAPRTTHQLMSPADDGGKRLQPGPTTPSPRDQLGPPVAPRYCDDRLRCLRLDYWTTIPISDSFAASAHSLYLETEHPLLCFFDANLVIGDLVHQRHDFCTPFLVSALLYTACQCYTSVDINAISYSNAFFSEATKLKRAERSSNNPANLAAMMQFGFGCTMSGEEDLVFENFKDVRRKAAEMSLFGVQVTAKQLETFRALPPDRLRESAHIAWGAYNSLSLHSMFFHEKPIPFPPQLPIPGETRQATDGQFTPWAPHPLPEYMGDTFVAISKISTISQDVLTVYTDESGSAGTSQGSLAFAESKFQELLASADDFSKRMMQNTQSPAHVLVFFGFFHGLVLDIFRPFTKSMRSKRLETFSALNSFPEEVFSASVNQLKRLLFTYVSQLQPSLYSLIFGTSVLHINNVLLRGADTFEARFYFLLCMGYMKKMHTRYPVCADIMRAHLTMALENTVVTSAEAQQLLDDIKSGGLHHMGADKAITTCIVDFDRALTGSSGARAHAMAQRLTTCLYSTNLHEAGITTEIWRRGLT
ncbi:hypothetical protein HIM_03506 [Hirsutella minnesotensis 3608]|uniref:Transcription factor domain-containing protein n=1 Tax=Hirsutella minnesotensis 3608 TaxID=1043627 RepID=A0A0F7ZQG0_9HYPO|nr:hypothetical protein HIM_03506 [Hirsutella minnesotensis 3608]